MARLLHCVRLPNTLPCFGSYVVFAYCVGVTACGTSEVDVIVRRVAIDTPGAPVLTVPSQAPTTTDVGVGPPPPSSEIPPAPVESPSTPPEPATEPEPPVSPEMMLDAGVGSLPDASPCGLDSVSLVNPYRFSLQDGRCLEPGPAGLPQGWSVVVTTDCSDTDSLWQLVRGRSGSFEIRHSWWVLNMEVLHAGTAVGSEVVVFPPNDFANQRFLFRERDPGVAEISPLHAPERCLSASAVGRVQLAECEPDTPSQEWLIEAEDCDTRAVP